MPREAMNGEPPAGVKFFRSPAELRKWFAANHARATEVWIGFRKKATGEPSISWPESVDEALCVGWIDGIRKSLDERSYAIRFTPRKPGSIWSAVNIARAEVLIAAGRMHPNGVKAFDVRRENRSGVYSYEQRRDRLEEPYESVLRKHGAAWSFFQAQPPSYRKTMGWWVVSARKEETRRNRLVKLIEACANGRRL